MKAGDAIVVAEYVAPFTSEQPYWEFHDARVTKIKRGQVWWMPAKYALIHVDTKHSDGRVVRLCDRGLKWALARRENEVAALKASCAL